jgi:hypothetical protein
LNHDSSFDINQSTS